MWIPVNSWVTLLLNPLFFNVCTDSSPWRGIPALCKSKVAVMDSGVIEGGLNVTLTIRLLMHGKVKSPISLSCQYSIFYDLFMEYSVTMWPVKAEVWKQFESIFDSPELSYYIGSLLILPSCQSALKRSICGCCTLIAPLWVSPSQCDPTPTNISHRYFWVLRTATKALLHKPYNSWSDLPRVWSQSINDTSAWYTHVETRHIMANKASCVLLSTLLKASAEKY